MEEYSNDNGDQEFAEDTANAGFADQDTNGSALQTVDGEGDKPGDRINASKNDDDERKIFVGGLSWETTVDDLREYFNKFGKVEDCTLKTDLTTGRSRGFGFVMFESSADVDKVVAETSHTLHGRSIDPKRAKARGGKEPIKKVFVGGLDPETPEDEIRKFFGQYGKIEEIDLPYDKNKQQRRAFCFITFESEAIVDACCEKPKQTIAGKEVDVKKAAPKENNGGFYGRGRGFPGRGFGRGRGRGGYNDYGQGYDYNYGPYGGYDYGGYGGYGGYGYGGYDYYNQGWGNNYQGYGNSGYGNSGGYGNNYGGKKRYLQGAQKPQRN